MSKFWIARDRAGYLKAFPSKPEFIYNRYWQCYEGGGREIPKVCPTGWWEPIFDDITFENSPVEVELTLNLK